MPLATTLLAGRYRVIERVGSGGMATVLLAEDERLGRQVAVKRLHAESPENTAARFKREAKLGASLNHPNVVSVYDIVTDDEGVLIVMEYVDGQTLRDAIERGPTEPGRAIQVLRGLAAALDHAHEEGIVHRDVKPANVLLGSDGVTVKLADLGIATAVEGTRITMSGTVLGTAAYMAPEQLEGQKPGPEADIYALGVVAYETLTGRRAYEGRTPLAIATRKASEPPPRLDGTWPAAAAELLATAMGPDPAARPRSGAELVDELERALAPEPSVGQGSNGRAQRATEPLPPRAAQPIRRREPEPAQRETRPRAAQIPASPRRRRLGPVVVALFIAAVCATALIALTGNGDSPSQASHQRTAVNKDKGAKAGEKPAQTSGAQPSSAPSSGAEPSQPDQTYAVPAAAGNSASEGYRLNLQGKALSDRGDYAAAIPVLERALRAFPQGTTAQSNLNFAYTLFNLGHALNAGGRPADAVPVLEERLKNPNQRGTVQAELDAAKRAASE